MPDKFFFVKESVEENRGTEHGGLVVARLRHRFPDLYIIEILYTSVILKLN